MSDFADRWVLVSGASSGLGRAIARELSDRGARVVLIGRRRDKLEETAALCTHAEICVLDLAQHDGIVPAVTALSTRLGRLYGLVHCAGVAAVLPLSASKPERMRAMYDLNFVAGVELARGLTRREVLDEAGGSILWIGSVAAHVGAPGQIKYCASKGAVTAAARAMRATPARRWPPRGRRARRGLSAPPSTWITGADLAVDGGYMLH